MRRLLPWQPDPSEVRAIVAVPATAANGDHVESAEEAGLRYVNDTTPGIRRKMRRGKPVYLDTRGNETADEKTIARINSLAIPPAWTDVWICPSPRGHIQATGRDAKGRKQYRYHPKWHEVRDETKYARMIAFGMALPGIRKRVERDLARPGMPREKVLATVVRLLETTLIRVGNDEYARTNNSVGLTTMRDKHVRVNGSEVRFSFRGKGGKEHTVGVRDRRLARVVKQSRDIPGYELFQYIDEDGERQTIDSGDVNGYLREIAGEEFTAKDFRTWAGTVLASIALQEFEEVDSEAQAKRNVVQAIERVAERLGNTPAICRKCYIHPAVLDSYLEGTMLEALRERTHTELTRKLSRLQPEEAAVLVLLQHRLSNESRNDQRNGRRKAS
jgi:DNA topoisomerase-1